MADETNVNVETQKTTTGDENTQTDANKNDNGNGAGNEADKGKSQKKPDETQEQFYQRRIQEAEDLARRRTGEAEHYRKEAQRLRDKPAEANVPDASKVEEKKEERPVQQAVDETKKLRIEMALGAIKDPNKRALVKMELDGLSFENSSEAVMSAVEKAESIVDAPYLRRVAQKRGEDHMRDVEIAGQSDVGTHGQGSKSDNAIHPEAAATIAEARRMNGTTK